jgi:hypothetical protein
MAIPLTVLQFAMLDSADGGITPANPIAWRETADEWVIVYEDGRKLRHAKSQPHDVPIDSQVAGAAQSGRSKESRSAHKQSRHD